MTQGLKSGVRTLKMRFQVGGSEPRIDSTRLGLAISAASYSSSSEATTCSTAVGHLVSRALLDEHKRRMLGRLPLKPGQRGLMFPHQADRHDLQQEQQKSATNLTCPCLVIWWMSGSSNDSGPVSSRPTDRRRQWRSMLSTWPTKDLMRSGQRVGSRSFHYCKTTSVT
jgi:hypothetical protein